MRRLADFLYHSHQDALLDFIDVDNWVRRCRANRWWVEHKEPLVQPDPIFSRTAFSVNRMVSSYKCMVNALRNRFGDLWESRSDLPSALNWKRPEPTETFMVHGHALKWNRKTLFARPGTGKTIISKEFQGRSAILYNGLIEYKTIGGRWPVTAYADALSLAEDAWIKAELKKDWTPPLSKLPSYVAAYYSRLQCSK